MTYNTQTQRLGLEFTTARILLMLMSQDTIPGLGRWWLAHACHDPALGAPQWSPVEDGHLRTWHVLTCLITLDLEIWEDKTSREKSGKVRSHDPGFSHIPACAPKRASTWCVSACPKCKRKSYKASSMYDKGPSWSLSISTKNELLPWALHVQWSSPLLLYYWTLINSAEICRRTWCLQAILLKIGVFFHVFYVSFFSHNMHLACICAFLVVAPHSQHICALNSAWKYENTKWQSWYTDLRGEILHRNIGTSQHLERSELQPRLTNIHITCRCPKALEALRLTGQCNTWKHRKRQRLGSRTIDHWAKWSNFCSILGTAAIAPLTLQTQRTQTLGP